MQINEWDEHYKDEKYLMWWPSENLVRYISSYFNNKKDRKSINILDFGCGNGRHLRLLKESVKKYDFDINLHGVDISAHAVELARNFLKDHRLDNENIDVYDGEKLKYENSSFNLVYSIAVLDQLKFSQAQQLVDEIYRVLGDDGTFVLDIELKDDSSIKEGDTLVEANTVIVSDGCEKGMYQHYFEDNEIKRLFAKWGTINYEYETIFSRYSEMKKLSSYKRVLLTITKKR